MEVWTLADLMILKANAVEVDAALSHRFADAMNILASANRDQQRSINLDGVCLQKHQVR